MRVLCSMMRNTQFARYNKNVRRLVGIGALNPNVRIMQCQILHTVRTL